MRNLSVLNNDLSSQMPRSNFLFPFEQVLDSFFNEFTKDTQWSKGIKTIGNYPKMDVVIDNNKFIIKAAVPGHTIDTIKAEMLPDRMVKISGEICEGHRFNESDNSSYIVRELRTSQFSRMVNLPDDVEDEQPEAILKDGILTLIWNRTIKNKKEKQKLIEIKSQ